MGPRSIRRALLRTVRMFSLHVLPHPDVHSSPLHLKSGESCIQPSSRGFERHLLERCTILRTYHSRIPPALADKDVRILASLRESSLQCFFGFADSA